MCVGMVPAIKPKGNIRIDLTNLNEAVCGVAYITISRAVTDPVEWSCNFDQFRYMVQLLAHTTGKRV